MPASVVRGPGLRLATCSDCRLVQRGGSGGAAAIPPESAGGMPPRAMLRRAEAIIAWLGLPAGSAVGGLLWPGPLLRAFAAQGMAAMVVPAGLAVAQRLRASDQAPPLLLCEHMLGRAAAPQDILAGMRLLLAPGGVLVLDLPSLAGAPEHVPFEAFGPGLRCWFTLATAEVALLQHGLVVFDAEPDAGDGVSFRLFVRHVEDRGKPVTEAVEALRQHEAEAGLARPETWRRFAARVTETRDALRAFLRAARRAGRRVAGHVAAGQGELLLAHAGIGPELLPFVVDRDPCRQGGVLPGLGIPIRAPAALRAERPDLLLLLAGEEGAPSAPDLAAIRDWGGRFVLPGRAMTPC